MAGENLGASFSIDITELKAGLAQANRLIRESESEFREAAAGMDDWTDSQEGLTKRVKTLTDQVGIQQKKVNALSAEKKRLITQMKAEGKSNEEIERAVDGVNKQIERESKQLDKLRSDLKKSEKALDDFGEEAEDAGGSLEGLKTAGGIAVKAIAAVGATAVAAVGAFLGLAGATREYRQDMAQLAQNASDAGVSLDAIKDKVAEVGAVTGEADAALEGMNMLMATGLDTSQIETASDALAGAATKYDGLKFEGMAEGLQETLATGVAVGPFAELIERTGGDLDAFNAGLAECTTEAERQAYAMRFLTKSGLLEANKAYKKTNKSLVEAAKAETKFTDTIAKLGAIAEPIMTQLKLSLSGFLDSLVPFISLVGEGLSGAFEGTAGASDKLAEGLRGIVDQIIETANNLFPVLIDVINSLLPAIVESIAEQTPKIINLIASVIPTLADTILEQLPSLLQVILDSVPQILNLLSDILPQILDKIMSIIPTLIIQIVDSIPSVLQAAIKLFSAIIKAIPKIIVELINALPEILEAILGSLNDGFPMIVEGAVDLLLGILEAIPAVIVALVKAVPKIIVVIVKALAAGIGQIVSVGGDLIAGLWEGIKGMGGWLWDKIKGFGESILGWFKDIFGINSPSKLMADVVGKNLALGIGEGFIDEIGGVSADINRAAAKISPTVEAKVKATSAGLASGKNNGTGGNVVNVYQNNQYSKAHSRYEIYKSKQATAAAVRLAMGGT